MYVKITATNQELVAFLPFNQFLSNMPLVSGKVYEAYYSKIDNVEYKTFFDVIIDNQTIVRGIHESRLKILTQDEIRDFRINQIIC